MQAKAASILRLDDGDEGALEDEPPPILYTYPLDYALSTWQDHERNGSWPDGTCYNDQDPALIAMWDSLTARYQWWFDKLQRDKEDADEFGKLAANNGNRPRQSLGSLFSD